MTTQKPTKTKPDARSAMRGLVVAAAACLALAGCSSGDTDGTFTYDVNVSIPAAAGALPDPCALLTPPEIAAASGVELADGIFNANMSNDTQSICEWKPSDGVFPIVQVYISAGAGQIATQRATAESMMGAAVDVTVPGAQGAYAVTGGSILGMAVGDYFVQVSYMTTDTADVLGITSALAADAAAAL